VKIQLKQIIKNIMEESLKKKLNTLGKTEVDFFQLRKEGKIYVSKVFKLHNNSDEVRNIKIVFENSQIALIGEIEGAMTLRMSPNKKQQVLTLVTQDDKKIKRLTFQKFVERKSGDYKSYEENSFTFRGEEFQRILQFLKSINFIDFSNLENFQIEDFSSNQGNKAIVDSSAKDVIHFLESIKGEERNELLLKIKNNLSKKDIDILLGRKDALEIYKTHLQNNDWNELEWQIFFEKEDWIFGYGLDYRIMKQYDREVNLSSVGTDNKEKVIVDYLMTFTDFTVTVEIKKPNTQIFNNSKNRSGSWTLHSTFIDAVTQVLEQKAEWTILSQNKDLYNKSGSEKLFQRTRDSKSILVIGNKFEFLNTNNIREREIKQDTFELFRRDSRNLEIITFDELFERASYIINK